MKNNKAFTLIELLVVIIVLGVILAIAIPSVSNIISSRGSKIYDQQMRLVKTAVNGYVLRYKGELLNSGDGSCYKLPYEKLLEYELLIENEISCDGNIIINKNDDDYDFDYYLTCIDEDGTEFSNAGTIPSGCIEIK